MTAAVSFVGATLKVLVSVVIDVTGGVTLVVDVVRAVVTIGAAFSWVLGFLTFAYLWKLSVS